MNIAQLERDRDAKIGAADSKLKAQMTAASAEGNRLRTPEEVAEVDALLADVNSLNARIERAKGDEGQAAVIDKLTAGMTHTSTTATPTIMRKSMGQQFVESAAFDFFRKGGHRTSSAWTSPSVELYAATLTTDAASGGDLIIPDHRPGILPLLFKRLVVADLLASGTTDSNLISFMKETTFTNAAAAVLEGGTKPESTLVFDAATSEVRKLAHWLPVTEEMLEDVGQIRSYIDARLRLGLDLTEEDQLLNGNGTAPNLRGILQTVGLTAAQARGADTNADAFFKQITTIATTIFTQPTGIVMNPANWQTVQLTKNAAGNYLGSGPWAPAQPAQLWGLPVAVTPSIVANTGLVGDFRGSAQVFRKGGVRVEASNSHSDFFIKNLQAIRAEERLALAVYRPAAFGTVTGLN